MHLVHIVIIPFTHATLNGGIMSIHIGNTRLTAMPNGTKPLFFATCGTRLVYPDALFQTRNDEATTYISKSACQQVALQFDRTSLRKDIRDDNHQFEFTNDGGWSSVIPQSDMNVIWRYRTELKLKINNTARVRLGFANVGIGTAVFIGGVAVDVPYYWTTFDVEFVGHLAAGGSWAPVIESATGYINERNTFVTFRAD